MTAPRKQLMSKVQARGLSVTAQEADAFPFDHADILIAEGLIAGARSPAELEEFTGLKAAAIKERLLDSTRSAWISRQISKAVEARLGQVMGAVYARVLRNGDPQAARLLLGQYGALLNPVARKEVLHLSMDLSQLTDAELKQFIAEHTRGQHGVQTAGSAPGAAAPAGSNAAAPAPVVVEAQFEVHEGGPAGQGAVPDPVGGRGPQGGEA
ncbi:MAG: hypothetical protein WC683_07275 [bacterium]